MNKKQTQIFSNFTSGMEICQININTEYIYIYIVVYMEPSGLAQSVQAGCFKAEFAMRSLVLVWVRFKSRLPTAIVAGG